ncbi:Ion transport protein-domain-containing protein [Suillus bovinus]|uniref:Ion transport protein-domain-containing protein n=1 Tax=Suillus bovinus TaxID=48563 RepID=UPI001B871F01|nr:Ion transport protein-domain-containing protein [Suillus bovinus]KAG2155280.1 Ion transport protein-domain-containing protein [Suillus bovinus]
MDVMDDQPLDGQHHSSLSHSTQSSSSSAIDLTVTITGLATSAPPSPSPTLHPSVDGGRSVARRRASWARLDVGQDPLRPNLSTTMEAGPSRISTHSFTADEDPVYSPDNRFFANTLAYNGKSVYNDLPYTAAQAAPSSASLMSTPESDFDSSKDGDDVHLNGTNSRWKFENGSWASANDLTIDSERTGAATGSTRRRTLRYSSSPSPLKRTGSAFRVMSKHLQRASLRVVNLSGHALDNSIRIPDEDFDDGEYSPTQDNKEPFEEQWNEQQVFLTRKLTPLRGRTLGFLESSSTFRLRLYRFLSHPWTEPLILCLIILNACVLISQASHSVLLPSEQSMPTPQKGFFLAWEDYVLFGLFILFTFEAVARICVSGFLLDPEVPISAFFVSSTSPIISTSTSSASGSFLRSLSLRPFYDRISRPFKLSEATPSRSMADIVVGPSNLPRDVSRQEKEAVVDEPPSRAHLRNPSQPTFFSRALRSDQTPPDVISLPFRLNIDNARDKVYRNMPYLRQSWGRIDLIAILSFWLSFALAMAGVERGSHHVAAFRAMTVLRIARLLAVTSGTTTIMHSLKIARPLLTNVAYFVIFAAVLFSIIGIQSFKGSFRRNCYLQPTLGENQTQISQFCGGYIDPTTLNVYPYLQLDGTPGPAPKGYICPLGQEGDNPYSGIQSFDNIYYAALQVVVVTSANGWSPIMYAIIDAEFFVSCFFFIVCILVLNIWLINLFVAVITNTFSAVRENTQKSAFGAAPLGLVVEEREEGWLDGKHVSQSNSLKEFYTHTRWCWVFLALASLVVQATASADMSELHQQILDKSELALTVAFDIEIIMRVVAELPAWRRFFQHGNNWLDLVLAVGSSVIQIPAIHNSELYPWLTIFQLGRFYRVILEFPRMKPLMTTKPSQLTVFGNLYGLANMTLFLLLVNLFAALVCVELIRGDMYGSTALNFGQLWNSFLAVYQIFSSENWTNVLYSTADAEISLGQAAIVIVFLCSWLIFANFIVMQMFIAVIHENFSVAEETKKSKQASDYWTQSHPQRVMHNSWTRKLNPYRWIKADPVRVKVENLPSNLVLPMQKTLVQDYGVIGQHNRKKPVPLKGARHLPSKSLTMLQQLFSGTTNSNDLLLVDLRQGRRESTAVQNEEMDRYLDIIAKASNGVNTTENDHDEHSERRAQKADFIIDHPTYDKTFWLFSQEDRLRNMCQKIVKPAGGERLFGAPPSDVAHTLFQLLILLTVLGGIIMEAVATPLYRRNYYMEHGLVRGTWFNIAEMAFGVPLLVEFIIKIIADGFLFTPNAYVKSIWNILDFIILIGILVNLSFTLIFVSGLTRFIHALKALRALRLVTLIEKMRNTFESLIISGVTRILDAAILAILYLIPFSVWGVNIFAGLMNECSDNGVQGLGDCTNEYVNTIYGTSFGYLAPRAWENPSPSTTFSFDNFRSSMLILFEIVSLEGWIDVMLVSMSITGKNQQPQVDVSQINAIFFVIYNLLGGVVILTLFVSIIIGNFSSKTGSAFLTQPQREWIDLQKLIKRQKPSERPQTRPTQLFRAWCYDRAIHKHGWWTRMMTCFFVVQIIVLMTQTFTVHVVIAKFQDDFSLIITTMYVVDIAVRFYGVGWRSFRANGWNLFDVVVAGGSFITTLVVRFGYTGFAVEQLQKLFLVSIAFKLVQRTNSLNQLFKTVMASLPVILNLLGLWFILFIFFAIMYMEVFGLTKWYSAETHTQNYQTMGSALVMLAFMSTGEGWNQYMHDFALAYPRCTIQTSGLVETDCGSTPWAFSLFIAWNLLSMYIFVNMFTGVVVQNFSYVFQSTGAAKAITREEIRSFKKTWAEYSNPKTGLLEQSRLVPFLGKLNGVFEVRIYPTEYSVPSVVSTCKDIQKIATKEGAKVETTLNTRKLNKVLRKIDFDVIRQRRAVYCRLLHEASIIDSHRKGISFTDMLFLLAHHKLIVDRDALELKDLIVRQGTNKLVSDLVNLDRVRSLLKMISLRRRYLVTREMALSAQREIPAIQVDPAPSTPPPLTRDITSPRSDYGRSNNGTSSPTPSPRTLGPSPELNAWDHSFRSSLQRSRRTSDVSMLSADMSHGYWRDGSLDIGDQGDIMSSMQRSIWGEIMQQAAEEDA